MSLKKLVMVVGAGVAGYFAAKKGKELLEDKPLKNRIDDIKVKVGDAQIAAQNKVVDIQDKAKVKYSEVMTKLDELYQGKKDDKE